MNLPKDFTEKMKELLNDEFEGFIKSYKQEHVLGLRVNTLKITLEDFKELSPFSLRKVPWVKEGFFYHQIDRPGKHPFHDAGLYYIQEPSAMAVGEIVDPQPGEKVLDLSAAPGGKTTHMVSKMNHEGILFANEIHPGRAKVLSQNIERMGIKNVVVSNESPERLSQVFPSYFDRILVDAPCSGEGMFRKHPEVCQEWSLENVRKCSIRQLNILEHAAMMLRPGGRLVYSTCTFSPEENEGVISKFIQAHRNFEIEAVQVFEGFSHGRKEWAEDAAIHVDQTIRLWPHKIEGEGHFIAVLRKTDGEEITKRKYAKPLKNQRALNDYFQFTKEALTVEPKGNFALLGEQLYLFPDEMLNLDGLKVLRPGWHLGTLKKNRFEPSHAFALSLRQEDVQHSWNVNQDSDEIMAYLRGESLKSEGEKGWYLIQVNGYSLGWAKLSNGLLKNRYPKGLRWKLL